MVDRAFSKQIFEVSNAPSNKRKKTSPNLFCSCGHREHDEFSKGENCWGFVWWWLKTGYALRFGKIARVKFAEELGTMSKNSLRWITLVGGPIWEIHSLTLMISSENLKWFQTHNLRLNFDVIVLLIRAPGLYLLSWNNWSKYRWSFGEVSLKYWSSVGEVSVNYRSCIEQLSVNCRSCIARISTVHDCIGRNDCR